MQPWDSFIKKNTLSLGTSSLGQPASSSMSQAKSDFAKRRQIELDTAGFNLSNLKKESELSEASQDRKRKIAELTAELNMKKKQAVSSGGMSTSAYMSGIAALQKEIDRLSY
jgi:hypothetical protein